MSGSAKAAKPASSKPAPATTKGTAPLPKQPQGQSSATPAVNKPGTTPLPKQPGQSPATPAMAKLRRALGELITAFKNRKTHMFQIYAFELRSSLDAALKVRHVATETERTELDGLRARAQVLLTYASSGSTKTDSDDGWAIDWDYVADTIDQISPGFGQAVTKAPQVYRDCFEAIWLSTQHMKTAFMEQWAEIQKHWFEFLYATATLVALETAALISSAVPGTHLLGIVLQGLIIAFVAYAAVTVGIEASQLASAFWQSVKDANGDPQKINAASLNFARLVIFILRLLAEAAVGGALTKISMKGIRHVAGDQIVTPRPPKPEQRTTPEPTSKPATEGTKPKQSLPAEQRTTPEPTSSKPANEGTKPAQRTVEKTRVTEPVKGVWEQTEHPRFHQPEFADLTITERVAHRNGVSTALTEVLDSSGKRIGHVIRNYNPTTGLLELTEAFLDKLPSKIIPADGKMMTPTGTPTQTYLTLRQMKALGVKYGGLKKVKMSTIQNIQSIIELHVMKTTEPTMSMAEKVKRTASVSYAETTFTQSGHRIVDVKLGEAHVIKDQKLGHLMDHYERVSRGAPQKDPAVVAKHDALLKKYGQHNGRQLVTRDTVAIYNYDIEITLAPRGGTQ